MGGGTKDLTSLSKKDTRAQVGTYSWRKKRGTECLGKQAYCPAWGSEMNFSSQQVVKGPQILCYTWRSVTPGPRRAQPDTVQMDPVEGRGGGGEGRTAGGMLSVMQTDFTKRTN